MKNENVIQFFKMLLKLTSQLSEVISLIQVPDAIQDLRDAGIKVCMVTGDNLSSAGAFGSKSGLLSPTGEWPLREWSYYGCDSKVLNNVS